MNSVFTFYQFDPFPYTFLTLVVSLEVTFLSTFILISQNHETQLTECRNHLDLQIHMLAEQENTKMLELLQAIAETVGISFDDVSVKPLLGPIDPQTLVEQITSAKGDDPKVAASRGAGLGCATDYANSKKYVQGCKMIKLAVCCFLFFRGTRPSEGAYRFTPPHVNAIKRGPS